MSQKNSTFLREKSIIEEVFIFLACLQDTGKVIKILFKSPIFSLEFFNSNF